MRTINFRCIVSEKKEMIIFVLNLNLILSVLILDIFSNLNFEFAASLANELTAKFINGEVDKVLIVYNEFKSVIQQKIDVKQFLPIESIEENSEEVHKHIEYIYEPDQEEIMNTLLPRHLKGQFWTVLLDILCCGTWRKNDSNGNGY